jgi:hypothetical protein
MYGERRKRERKRERERMLTTPKKDCSIIKRQDREILGLPIQASGCTLSHPPGAPL